MRESAPPLLALVIPALIIMLSVPMPAYAYVDPGTGSYLLQVTLAIVFAALFAIKHYFQRIKAFLTRHRQKDAPSEPK